MIERLGGGGKQSPFRDSMATIEIMPVSMNFCQSKQNKLLTKATGDGLCWAGMVDGKKDISNKCMGHHRFSAIKRQYQLF